jgi:hypothetical protein
MKLFRSAMFWLFFLIPFVGGVTYYLAFASNQYEALAHFTIEKMVNNNQTLLAR